jgi:hypothetical protein
VVYITHDYTRLVLRLLTRLRSLSCSPLAVEFLTKILEVNGQRVKAQIWYDACMGLGMLMKLAGGYSGGWGGGGIRQTVVWSLEPVSGTGNVKTCRAN